jgi:phi13 family phage major tail protein
MGKGVIIGMRNLVYAKLIDDVVGGSTTYEAPKLVAGAISANVNPNGSNGTLFADDGPFETASTIGEISVELNVADLDLDTQADLLGHTVSGGKLRRNKADTPPWVAIGYKSLKSNGKYRYTWLFKGKFAPNEQANTTKGDSVEFQTPTIAGSFVARESDGDWQHHIDEDHIDYMSSMGANWFNNPEGGVADTVAPTVTSVVPAAAATAVAVGANIVWTFSEALALSTVHTGNFMLLNNVTGAGIPGTLSINAARTQVTFDPTNNLAAATVHRAVVSDGVKDLAGNKLAAASSTTFTTA